MENHSDEIQMIEPVMENHEEDVQIIEILDTSSEHSNDTINSITSPNFSSVRSNDFNDTNLHKMGREIINFQRELIEKLKVITVHVHVVEGDDVTFIQETIESFYDSAKVYANFGGFYRELFYDEQYEQGNSELIKDGFLKYLNEM